MEGIEINNFGRSTGSNIQICFKSDYTAVHDITQYILWTLYYPIGWVLTTTHFVLYLSFDWLKVVYYAFCSVATVGSECSVFPLAGVQGDVGVMAAGVVEEVEIE